MEEKTLERTTPAAAVLPEETLAFFGGDDLRARVFHDKYALRDEGGRVVETTPVQMWQRVAREMASVESTPQTREVWARNFEWLLSDFRFIPGGRIMFGAGNGRRVTLLNCYVVPIEGDSLEDIFEWCKRAGRTYSFGGGVGTDISVLRPKGSPVNNAALTSSGATSFMELLSTTTGTIGQSGRRGALMITIADDHPDVLEFTKIKRNLTRVRYANISVRVSDAFMRAVESDGEFSLAFESERAGVRRTVRARDIWRELIRGARDYAEPGVIFWDTVTRWSTSEYDGMNVITTNPCSEIPLEPYGACCLGSLHLAEFVLDEFEPTARIDWPSLERALRYATRFLDNVLDYNADKHPLPQQREASLRSRRIGVGFTGMSDMLAKLRLRYDSDEAITSVDATFDRIKNVVYDESTRLAEEKGTFPAFRLAPHLRSPFVATLAPEVLARVRAHGLRNVALLTVPPVGSGASLAGTTSGVEPIFDVAYVRRSESLSRDEFKVYHPLVRRYMERRGLSGEGDLPPFFVTAHEISPLARVRMQAVIQKHIDHSISSTVNLPESATEADVERVYLEAWKHGCKGITVYREGSREGILISEAKAKEQPARGSGDGGAGVRPRPKVTQGRTERIETPRGRIYVTINEDEHGICEVFVESLDVEADAIGRLTSVALRCGADPREVIEQLWRVQSKEIAFDRAEDSTTVRVSTISQGVALGIGRYLYGPPFRPDKEFPRADLLPEPSLRYRQERLRLGEVPAASEEPRPLVSGNGNGQVAVFAGICPDCGDYLVHENGCVNCRSCGYSRC